jgi:hypothetical protein
MTSNLIWFSLIIFSLHNRSPLLLLFCSFCNRPTQFLVLFSYSKQIDPICLLIPSCYFVTLATDPPNFLFYFSYSKEIDPIYLLIPSLTYSVLDLIAFFSFLVTINLITCLLASLIGSRFDCFIPTR